MNVIRIIVYILATLMNILGIILIAKNYNEIINELKLMIIDSYELIREVLYVNN